VLESHGYRVLDAGDSAAAEQIAKVYVGPIHVLLVEMDVFGTSGLTLAERLRSLRPEPSVLFMSGQAQTELVKKGALGARTPFIRKPFKAGELALKVRRVLGDVSPLGK
jgi:two-component system cell cycle sensor histidine kinase/response regulator CckA